MAVPVRFGFCKSLIPMTRLLRLIITGTLALWSQNAMAQNWSFDAHTIGMGGTGSTGNLASSMIDKERRYTPIVLPFGLFQVLSDLNIYDPNSPKFDPIRAIEYASSPLHYVVGRDTSSSAEALFVSDIRDATFSRDLSRYRGFVPANDICPNYNVGQAFSLQRASARLSWTSIYLMTPRCQCTWPKHCYACGAAELWFSSSVSIRT